MLYPLKFRPQLLPKIWGGQVIKQWYDHAADYENVGEAWVISDFYAYPTEVANGSHAGDTLHDLLEVYMDELVGGKVYDLFGNKFPLLFKFIDATDDLSVQVHPDDDYALEHDDSLGKNEMWYVLPSGEDASIFLGWNEPMDAARVREAVENGTLARYLREHKVHAGDVANITAGTVHAMRKNTIVAEIQENSDMTYRLYDYDRVGADGKKRPLHLDKALDVLDYSASDGSKLTGPLAVMDGAVNLLRTPYFTTNILTLSQSAQRDYAPLDSFVAYMCVDGECTIKALDCDTPDNTVALRTGEAVLVPASINDIVLTPAGRCQLIETYVEL